jgi:hypothetical protein
MRHSDADRGMSPVAVVHRTRSSNAAARSLGCLVMDASTARRNGGAGVSAAVVDRSRVRRCSERSSAPSDGPKT